jgi:hypothetical protein
MMRSAHSLGSAMCKQCAAYNEGADDPTRTLTLRQNYAAAWTDRLRSGLDVVADSAALAAFNSYLMPEAELEAYVQDTLSLQFEDGWDVSYIAAAVVGAYTQGALRLQQPIEAEAARQNPLFERSLSNALPRAEQSTLDNIARSAALLTVGLGSMLDSSRDMEQAQRLEALRVETRRVSAEGRPPAEAVSAAHTIIVWAHAESMLDYYQSAGVVALLAQVEFVTAGDDRVCPECESLAGQTYPLLGARGIIPVHIGCRCSWWPKL